MVTTTSPVLTWRGPTSRKMAAATPMAAGAADGRANHAARGHEHEPHHRRAHPVHGRGGVGSEAHVEIEEGEPEENERARAR